MADWQPSPGGDQPNVLIVEDEPLNALYVSSVLEHAGFTRVRTAGSSAAARRAAGQERPDLVIMDITLGKTDSGIDLATALQDLYGCAILYVTAHADAPTRERAIATGPAGYLLKPFDSTQLLRAVERACAQLPSARRLA